MSDAVTVISGGAQGIGRAIAERLLKQGQQLVILDSDAGAAAEFEAEHRGRVHARAGDAADEALVAEAVALAQGCGQLQGVVANAGISINRPLEELSLAQWNRVLGVNLTGPFLLARQAAPALRATGGAMVLIGSSRALMSEANTEAYSASKGGVVALAHALAISLGPQVRVNCVSPGWIATEGWQRRDHRREPQLSAADHAQHPVGRVGRPEDVAALVAFLLSDEAGFITGAHYLVDGGMTRKMIYT